MITAFFSTNRGADAATALRNLVQVNLDSADGFRFAAEHLGDLSLAALCDQIALERLAQADELGHFVPPDQAIPEGCTIRAALNRTWMHIRELLSQNNRLALFTELLRSEDYVKQAYEDALDKTIATSSSDTIVRQYSQVALAHSRIRDLVDLYRISPDQSG
jgi:uncharacterized protein (TIGR02284 family)